MNILSCLDLLSDINNLLGPVTGALLSLGGRYSGQGDREYTHRGDQWFEPTSQEPLRGLENDRGTTEHRE